MNIRSLLESPEMHFWEQFDPDAQGRIQRGRITLKDDRWRFNGLRYFDEHQQPFVDRGRLRNVPTTGGDFPREFASYHERVFAGTRYAKKIDLLTQVVLAWIESNGMPDCFIAIPSRRETHTTKAVEVILEDCLSSGMNPLAMVIHNDYQEPIPETLKDLSRIRGNPHCLVFDTKVSPETTIGEVRAVQADVVMQACYEFGQVKPLIWGDADITRVVVPGSYQHAVSLLEDQETAFVIGTWYFDPDTIKNNRTFALVKEIEREIQSRLQHKVPKQQWLSQEGGGAFLGIDIKYLPSFAGIPRMSVEEDHRLIMEMRYYLWKSIAKFPNPADVQIYVSGDRNARCFRNDDTGGRYDDFEKWANQPRQEVAERKLDKDYIVRYVNHKLERLISYTSYARRINCADRGELHSSVTAFLSQICVQYKMPIGQDGIQLDRFSNVCQECPNTPGLTYHTETPAPKVLETNTQ